MFVFFFFFQAEDGIRDYKVTGVQTCALPISPSLRGSGAGCAARRGCRRSRRRPAGSPRGRAPLRAGRSPGRSEEHTSELQSPCNLVCRLLLEKKKISSALLLFCPSWSYPSYIVCTRSLL